MSTARFKDLLARCGRPEIHLSWSRPTEDRVLQHAAAQKRLLTVHQEARGAKKDYATVGLHPGKSVQYLLFPKSLRAFADRRVVGIDYDSLGRQLSVSLPESTRHRGKTASGSRLADKRGGGGKVVPFAATEGGQPQHAKPAAPALQRPAKDPPLAAPRSWFKEVQDAVAELQAGRDRTALERLTRLLERGDKPRSPGRGRARRTISGTTSRRRVTSS